MEETFLLRWESGPCFQVFGVWIHSPLGHWNCCSKATIAETLRLTFSLVYWLGETDFSWSLFYLCVACSGLEASTALLQDGKETQGTHSLLSLSSCSRVPWNRFKGLDLIDRVHEELWTEVCDIVQVTGIKTIPKKKKCKKAKWLSEEALQIAVKRRKWKAKRKRKYIPILMQSSKE